MAQKLKIGIDADGVMCDFLARYRQLAFDTFGKPTPDIGPSIDWDLTNWGLTPAEDEAIWKRIKSTKNFWTTLGKMKGTENLADAALDYQVYVITSRVPTLGKTVEEQTCDWLLHNYEIKYPQVIVSEPAHRKGIIARGLELFAFIDDKPENCKVVQEQAATCKHSTYIRDQSYNRHECGCSFIRVPTLDTFLSRLP